MVIEPGNNSINTHSNASGKTKSPAPAESKVESATTTPAKQAESVSLSSAAQSVAKLESEIAAVSDVDLEKVSSLKSAVDSGSYTVDSNTLAQKLLEQDGFLE